MNEVLNNNEICILEQLVICGSAKKAAASLGVPNNKIYKITGKIKQKLNAKNLTNAVYIAYKEGLIN